MPSPELLSAIRLLAAGAWHEAETAARGATEADPNDLHAKRLLGLAIAAMGEDTRAAPILLRSAAEDPDANHPCVDLARLRPPLPRPLVARQFRACLRLSPADTRLTLDFAEFLLDADQPVLAEKILLDQPPSAAGHRHRRELPGALPPARPRPRRAGRDHPGRGVTAPAASPPPFAGRIPSDVHPRC